MAPLESEILSKLHRDAAHGAEPGGSVPGAYRVRSEGDLQRGRLFVSAIALAIAGVCVAGHGTGWGQSADISGAATTQPSADGAGVTTLHVTSREIVVDVTVTDAKGQPIRNLKQSDFALKEDDKPQPVRTFTEVSESTPPAPRVPQKLPPDVYTNLQPPPTTTAVNILLLDELNTLPADQVAMKQESMKYMKGMPKGTRIAVLGLGSSLRILQGFTADPAILIAAVDSKKNRALPSPFIDNDSTTVLDNAVDAQSDLENDDTAAMLQQFENDLTVTQQDIRNRMTLEALNQIAAYVAGIKGRKNLIWFTDGMPLNMFPTGGTNDLTEVSDYSLDLRKTTDLLTAAEVAVYPVDARKLFSNPANGADQHLDVINKNTGARVATREMQFGEKKGGELLSMEAVAEATGGAAYYNTNDLKGAVSKAIGNGANYYSLSYIPADLDYDGRYHAINVEVDRADVHLSYRKGYNSDDIQHNAVTPILPLTTKSPEPYGNNMQASMGRGVPSASQVLFDVRVVPSTEPAKPGDPAVMGTLDPKLAGKPLVRYDVLYFVPTRQITFTQGPGGMRKCSLAFDIAAYDVYGKLITGLSQTVSSPAMTTEQYQRFMQKPFQIFQQIDLPAGETFLRVGVLDGASDHAGTLEIPLVVPKKLARQAAGPGGKGGT